MNIPHADISISRREALTIGTVSPLALWLSSITGQNIEATQAETRRHFLPLILLYLEGGASYKETWNPDPPSAPENYRGEFGTISTRIMDHRFCELWPEMAQRADQLAIIRSIHSGNSDHRDALKNVIQPGTSETVAYRWGQQSAQGGPPYMFITPSFDIRYYFRSIHQRDDAFDVRWKDGAYVPPSIKAAVESERFRRREELRSSMGNAVYGRMVDQVERNRRTTISLLHGSGDFIRAFHPTHGVDLDRLPEDDREVIERDLQRFTEDLQRYGDNHVGRSLLLARRLVERGTGSVTISHGDNMQIDWDDHSDIFPQTRRKVPALDRAISALLDDLRHDRFEAVLAIVTEFGRTPWVNSSAGRDHWAGANTMILAGGPYVQKGVIVGKTHYDGSVHEGQLHAKDGAVVNTIIHACGGKETLLPNAVRAHDALR